MQNSNLVNGCQIEMPSHPPSTFWQNSPAMCTCCLGDLHVDLNFFLFVSASECEPNGRARSQQPAQLLQGRRPAQSKHCQSDEAGKERQSGRAPQHHRSRHYVEIEALCHSDVARCVHINHGSCGCMPWALWIPIWCIPVAGASCGTANMCFCPCRRG